MKVTIQDEVKTNIFMDVEIGEVFRFTDSDDLYMRISGTGTFSSVNLRTVVLRATSWDAKLIIFDAELIAKQRRV